MIQIKNAEIRKAMKAMHITGIEAARRCGVSAVTFSRWLNRELSEEETARILLTISQRRGK